jgi:hypothetical protein
VQLSAAPPGRYLVVRVADDDPELLVRLKDASIVPGAVVEVRDDEPRTVLVEAALPEPTRPGLSLSDLEGVRARPV